MSDTLFDTNLETPMSTELAEREVSPMELILSAVKDGSAPDVIAQIVELEERIDRRNAEKAFCKAMQECQVEMPSIVHDARNEKTGSGFVRLETIKKVAKPIWLRHGFTLSFGEVDCPTPGQKRIICDVTHCAGHTRRYQLDLPLDGIGPKGNPIGGMNSVQGAISTTSYGERRLTCMVWNITIAGEDDDGNDPIEYIDDKQIIELQELIESKSYELNRDIDINHFCGWLGVQKLSEINARDFNKAINGIKNLRK